MALASQTARMNEMGRSHLASGASSGRRRRQRKRTRMALGAAILAVAAVALWFLLPNNEPAPSVAASFDEPATSAAADDRSHAPAGDQPVRQAGGTPISEISMGGSGGAPSSVLPESTLAVRTESVPSASPAATPTTSPTTSPGPVTQPAANSGQPVVPPSPGALVAGPIGDMVSEAANQERLGRPLDARATLNRALHDPRASAGDREVIRERMARLNEALVFSPSVAPGDPLVKTYVVQPGDTLTRIAASQALAADWRFIMRVNRIPSPNRLTVGQTLKLVKGPFHAVLSKSGYRLDLYAGEPDAFGNRLYIRSFPVGLGEFGSTPLGLFVVRPQSKLINPSWRNPRTGEFFAADDPKNPLGEYWIGLDPGEEATSQYTDYGIHGTIEPESIGQEKSMGCVRLAEPDVKLLYEVLMDKVSTVRIAP